MLAQPPSPSPRSSFGAFLVEETIGAGGMGVVYRARHRDTGRQVAVKTVMAPQRQAAVQAEIRTLAGLRHPGIVAILDDGIEDGVPWYAMELLPGAPLSALVERLWPPSSVPLPRDTPTVVMGPADAPEAAAPAEAARPRHPVAAQALPEVLRVMARLCRPLSYLHASGLVHRDLKPANVVLKPDGQVVLVDFGLASESAAARGRETLDAVGPARGTVLYMSPEQCRGFRVDARADLYSFGCILYELLVGRPPFTGRTVGEILHHHLNSALLPASHLVSGLPDPLDRLVLRLLDKDPRRRIGYADEIEQQLDGLLSAVTGESASATPAPPAQPPCLYAPALCDRFEAMQQLERSIGGLAEGNGGAALLAGETGIGKTFLLNEVARRAVARGCEVITGAAAPPPTFVLRTGESTRSHQPLSLFQPLLRRALEVSGGAGDPLEVVLTGHAEVLLPVEPRFAGRVTPAAARVEGSPEETRTRLLAGVLEVVRALAARRPLLLILDDIQWADELSRTLLRALAEPAGRPRPLLLVGAFRDDDAEGAELENWAAGSGLPVLPLARMEPTDLQDMVADMLGMAAAPPPLAAMLATVSGGNPHLVAEYLRAAVADGVLRRRAGSWVVADGDRPRLDAAAGAPTSSALRALARRRLGPLSADSRDLLATLAVFGRPIEPALLLAAAQLEETRGFVLLAQLEGRAVVLSDADGRVRFAHPSLGECAYQDLLESEARERHRRVAATLEQQSDDRHLYFIGQHHRQAGDLRRAVSWLARAGQRALEAGFLGEAHQQLTAACDLTEADPTLVASPLEAARLQRRLGETLAGLGRITEAEGHLRQCLQLLRMPAPTSRRRWSWRLLTGTGRQTLLRLLPRRRAPSLEQAQTFDEAALANTWLGFCKMFSNQPEIMVGALLEAANRAERAATPTLACVPWTFLARIVGLIGLPAAADRYFRMARQRAEQAGDLTAVLRCHQSEAFYLHNAGQLDRAAAVVAAGLALCSGSASHYEQSALELVQAFVLIAQGDLRAAETVLTRVAQTSATYGNRFHEAQARKLLGVCAIESGHFEDARHTCLRLAQDARAAGNQLDWLNLSALACAALWRGGRPQLARPLAIELARESTRSAQLFHLFELQAYLPEILVGIWRTEPGDRELRALTRLSCRAAHKCARVFKVLQPAAWRALGCARAVAGDRRVAVRDLHRSLTLAQAYQMPVEAAVTSLELLRLQAVAADRTAAVAAEARETLRRTGAAYPHLLAALPGGDSGGGTISRE